MAPTLGYWNIRGLAQPIRLLLAYSGTKYEDKRYDDPTVWFSTDKKSLGLDFPNLAQPIRLLLAYSGTDYEDKRYNIGGPPDWDRSEWLNEKFTLGLDFPNLPYYIDGDVKLSQSLAIIRHIARKTKLDGQNEDEKLRVELVEQQLVDMNMALVRICYDPNFETLKVDYLKNLPTSLELLSNFLGDRPFLAGESVTYVDFMAYELLDKINLLASEELTKVANLKKYVERVEALPKVDSYLKTAPKVPLNGPMAKWGGSV